MGIRKNKRIGRRGIDSGKIIYGPNQNFDKVFFDKNGTRITNDLPTFLSGRKPHYVKVSWTPAFSDRYTAGTSCLDDSGNNIDGSSHIRMTNGGSWLCVERHLLNVGASTEISGSLDPNKSYSDTWQVSIYDNDYSGSDYHITGYFIVENA